MKFDKLRLLYIVFGVSVCAFIIAAVVILVGRHERLDDQTEFDDLYDDVVITDDEPSGDAADDVPDDGNIDPTPGDASTEDTSLKAIVDIDALVEKNSDCIGWLQIPGTTVNHPVMFTPDDEEYYIRRDFSGNSSKSGCLFAGEYSKFDPQCDNIIIYGHNMNSETMFNALFAYEDEEFYLNHKTFRFDTVYGNGLYEIFAVFRTRILNVDEYGFRYYNYSGELSEDDFNYYLENILELAEYDTGIDVEYGDNLLTLSTCAYHVTNGRLVVVAKKIAD